MIAQYHHYLLVALLSSTLLSGGGGYEFFDDFNRADNPTVGNGWIEDTPTDLSIESQALKFEEEFFSQMFHDIEGHLLDSDHLRYSCKIKVDRPAYDEAGTFWLMLSDTQHGDPLGVYLSAIFNTDVEGHSTSISIFYNNEYNPSLNRSSELASIPLFDNGDEFNIEFQSHTDQHLEVRCWKSTDPRPVYPNTTMHLFGFFPQNSILLRKNCIDWGFGPIDHTPIRSADDVKVDEHDDPFVRVSCDNGITHFIFGNGGSGVDQLDQNTLKILIDGQDKTVTMLQLLNTSVGHVVVENGLVNLYYDLDLSQSEIDVCISNNNGNTAGFKKD